MSCLHTQQPHIVALHCNCHIAALITNASRKVLLNELEDLTTKNSPKRLWELNNSSILLK